MQISKNTDWYVYVAVLEKQRVSNQIAKLVQNL